MIHALLIRLLFASLACVLLATTASAYAKNTHNKLLTNKTVIECSFNGIEKDASHAEPLDFITAASQPLTRIASPDIFIPATPASLSEFVLTDNTIRAPPTRA